MSDEQTAADAALSTSAYTILGMIGIGARSGYEIKRAVDQSVRHFWALSFRQIYPDLRRLEDQGLVTSSTAPFGGRKRTFYELTDKGQAALDRWLLDDTDLTAELRHSGMLKLFFADRLDPESRARLLDQIREKHISMRAELADARPSAITTAKRNGDRMPLTTLDFGVELNEFIINWCDRLQRRLDDLY